MRAMFLGGILAALTPTGSATTPPSAPAATAAAASGSATAKPAPTAPEKNPREDLLHPDVNYSIWLYVGPAAVIFIVMFYNEWDQRRKKKLAASPNKNPHQP